MCFGNRAGTLIVGSNQLEHYQRRQYGCDGLQNTDPWLSGSACYEGAAYSMRKARTGSIEAARRAGLMPEMLAASTRTPMAIVMTGTFTLVTS